MESGLKEEHPYKKEYLEAPLRLHKMKLECLQKRIMLMPEGKTEFEKNEVILDKIKTGAEIKALSTVVAEREAYYINYFQNSFLPDLEDLESNFGEVVAAARKRTEPEIVDLLAKVEFIPTGSINIEGKIFNFKLLKKLLAQHGK